MLLEIRTYHLQITSIFFSFYYYYYITNINKNIHEIILGSFLLPNNIILSVFFWNNPIKNSLIHKLDSIFAKITIYYCSTYYIFFKECTFYSKLEYILLFILLVYFAKKSHYYSTIEWCSKNHLSSHILIHFVMICGTLLAFM